MKPRQLRAQAIILRRTNYGEADRILQLLTADYGKISAIAKGVRREKSKLAGGLELLATCDVTIIQGRGDMGVVSSARLEQFYGSILRDYDRLQFAYEALRRIAGATENAPEPEFYHLLKTTLAALDMSSIDRRLVEIWFWLGLARLLGNGLNLRFDSQNQPLAKDQAYNFDVANMSFNSSQHGRFTSADIKLLRLASVKSPEILRQVSGLEPVLDNCLWLTRVVNE